MVRSSRSRFFGLSKCLVPTPERGRETVRSTHREKETKSHAKNGENRII